MPVGTNLAKMVFWAAIVVGLSYLIVLTPWLEVDDNATNATILLAWKGAGVWLLAVYAWLNAKSIDGALLVGIMALGALADVLVETDLVKGGAVFAVGHLVAIFLYWRNRRGARWLTNSQILAAFALAATPPIFAALVPKDVSAVAYAIPLGLMAAFAWTSKFTRYRVGIGAAMFVISDLIIFWQLGQEETALAGDLAIWALYFIGQALIALGVTQHLAEREKSV